MIAAIIISALLLAEVKSQFGMGYQYQGMNPYGMGGMGYGMNYGMNQRMGYPGYGGYMGGMGGGYPGMGMAGYNMGGMFG